MGAKKDLSFWCCPATASNLHLKKWRNGAAHLCEWTIAVVVWRWAGRGTFFYHHTYKSAWGQSGKQLPRISPGKPVCVPERSVKHNKPAELGCWLWSGWQRRNRERSGRAKLCHGVLEDMSKASAVKGVSALSHFLGKCGVGARHCWEAEGCWGLLHGLWEVHVHWFFEAVNRPWHKWRCRCQLCKLFETGTIILPGVYTAPITAMAWPITGSLLHNCTVKWSGYY